MKKSLLALMACMLLSVFATSAATVYFQNTKNWTNVYAYTWAPSDDITLLDALAPVTVRNAETNEEMTLYKKETAKENIIFLNAPSFLAANKQQTVDFKVSDGAVYTGDNSQIGTVEEVDGVLTYTAETPIEKNSGLFITYRTIGGAWTEPVEFVKTGDSYTIKNWQVYYNSQVKIYFAESGVEKQVGPANAVSVGGGNLGAYTTGTSYNVGFNNNFWTLTGQSTTYTQYDIKYDSTSGTVTFTKLLWTFYGVFRSESGVWSDPIVFRTVSTGMVYGSTFKAGNDSQFALFVAFDGQEWNKGVRYEPAGAAEVTGDFSESYKQGSSSTWLLDNEVPFGTWTVTVNHSTRIVEFKRNVQAIIVNNTPMELNDDTWAGALADGDAILFNINGVYSTLGELTKTIQGADVVYTTTLVPEKDAEPIDFESDNAIIKVVGENVTITLPNAVKPVMTIGDKSIELSGSGNFYSAEKVDLNKEDFSFDIAGMHYVASIPAVVGYDGLSITCDLLEKAGTSTFANAKSQLKDTSLVPFISEDGSFIPDVTINLATKKVIFSWDIATGVESIEADNGGEAVYYNLQGARVMNPVNGIFIEVKDGKAVKVHK